MKCSGGEIRPIHKTVDFFLMRGRCPDNFWIENGIMENMDKLGNIALEYATFLDGLSLYEEGSLWYFWWNFFFQLWKQASLW